VRSNSSLVSRLGLGAFVLALIVFLIPLVYALLGVAGVTHADSWEDINNLLSAAVIVGIVAVGLASVATVLNLPGVFSNPRHSGGALIASVLLMLLSVGFFFGIVQPRAADVQHIEYSEVPFLHAMNDNCETPLNIAIEDLTTIRNFADSTKTSDSGYAAGIGTYTNLLRTDEAKLIDGIQAVQQAAVPASEYQSLKDECLKSLKGMVNILDSSSAITVLTPLDKLLSPTVSIFGLLTASSGIVASGKLPSGTVQAFVSQALTKVIPHGTSNITDPTDILVKGVHDRVQGNTVLTVWRWCTASNSC